MRLNERCVAEFSTSSAPIDKEGFLNKKGELNRGYQRRWFILKGNLLYYFEKRSDKEPIGVIVLDNCHVEMAESGEPYAFQITFAGDGSRTYILGADTPKEMESWMRAITHSNYDCLRMMVESFESTLLKLTSEENDLATGSSSSSSSSNTNANASSGSFTDIDSVQPGGSSNKLSPHERYFSQGKKQSSAKTRDKRRSSEVLTQRDVDRINNKPPLLPVDSVDKSNGSNAINRTSPEFGDLINFEDDEQHPMQDEFSFNEGFYSISKHSEDLMPLSYSDLERLEDLHAEEYYSRLSGAPPGQSKDDSAMCFRPKPGVPSRSQRPKSERRRNNVRVYSVFDPVIVETSKPRTLTRSLRLSDDGGYLHENRSVFRYLHDLYSASIWVKCKDFEKQDLVKF